MNNEARLEQLKKDCVYWQEKLGISQWDICIKIKRMEEMVGGDCVGSNEFQIQSERALIAILDPIDYSSKDFPQSMERTLVHELLHIKMEYFAPIDQDSLQYSLLEATINRLAETLVELRHEKGNSAC